MSEPIFLVVGPPAVGKSSAGRALATHFPRSVHIPVDDLRHMVVSGLALPAAAWNDDIAQQVTLARRGAIHLARAYAASGFAVALDDFWDANCRADYGDLLGDPDLHKIILYPDQDTAHHRNLARSGDGPARAYIDEGIRIVYRELAAAIPQLTQEGWLVVDTTSLDVDGTATTILGLAGARGMVKNA